MACRARNPCPRLRREENEVIEEEAFMMMIDGEFWVMYKNGYRDPVYRWKGTNIETCVRQPDGTAKTGEGRYILGGMWYDDAGKRLYAPLHGGVDDGDEPPRRQERRGSRRSCRSWRLGGSSGNRT